MKKFIIPILFLCFTAFGLEQLVNPFVKFGSGRWTDSTGWNVGNRKSKVNGDFDITGSYKVNGVTISSGTPITADEEGSEMEDNITGLNFVGNLYTATTSTGTVTLTSTLDTNNIATFYKTAAFTGDVTAVSFQASNGIVCDALTVVGGSASSIAGTLTISDSSGFGNDVTIAGFTRLGNNAPAIKQKLVTGLSATGNSTVTFAHSLSFYKIIGASIWLRNDTAGTNSYFTAAKWIIAPQTSFSNEVLYYAGIDGTNCWARFPTGAVSTRGDSLFFLLTYIE